MSNINKKIAVFDLDGTITKKDTYLEFIKYVRGNLYFYFGLVILSPYIILFYLGFYNNIKLKELFFSFFFKNLKSSYVEQKGKEFSINILPSLCYQPAQKILKWHKDKMHDVLILTASSDIWVKGWTEMNGYALICTKFKKHQGFFTGEIDGKNCFGMEKQKLLKEYFKKHCYSYSFGYGDSSSDQYYLNIVNQPYLMSLNKKNVKYNWRN